MLFQFNNITFTGKFIATSKLHHIFTNWLPLKSQTFPRTKISCNHVLLFHLSFMASSQLNTLSCRWDSCYGWGRYLRFLFDQLQTFRFWAMSRDLSWLEVFRWSNDQVEMQRHEIEHCWMLILVHLTFSIFDIQSFDFLLDFNWSVIKRSISFFFKSSDLQILFRVRRRPCQIGLPPNPSICSPLETRNNYHCFKSDIIHHFRLGVKISNL